MKVILGADHAGFELKEKIKKYLEKKQVEYQDKGTHSTEPVDYPEYAFKVAKEVAQNQDKDYRGVLICGTGTGMTIAANKVRGIRAASAYDAYSAEMARNDNNTNVLGLRGRKFPFGKIKKILDIWLETAYSEKDRHERRIQEIKQYEQTE